MKADHEDLLQAATQRLLAEFHPEEIYLFGSRAWGTPDEDSDVDLMVIVPQKRRTPHSTRPARPAMPGTAADLRRRARANAKRSQPCPRCTGKPDPRGSAKRTQGLWMTLTG